jgi:ribosomal protein S18 acetylase RimI-like enzyme
MSISTSFSRFAVYYKSHGLRATVRRGVLAARRALFSNRAVLFYCDLSTTGLASADLPDSLKVERKRSYADIEPQDLHQIVNVWNPRLAQRHLNERFEQEASLWLIKFKDQLAGYGWTLQGTTIEPHYFPLSNDDVHLFDFYVFPPFRGQGMNPSLVTQVLHSLASDGWSRTFIEAAEWNHAQLCSLAKTPFRRLGLARKVRVFGLTIVCWDGRESLTDWREDKHHATVAVPRPEKFGVLNKR